MLVISDADWLATFDITHMHAQNPSGSFKILLKKNVLDIFKTKEEWACLCVLACV